MQLFRASRRPRGSFDPLDAAASVARDGWRYNDRRTPILYAAEVEALALLEVLARPGWSDVREIAVATLDVPDGSIASLDELGITLPSNWNLRPAGPNAQRIGAEFLAAVDAAAAAGRRVCGLRVPSVISSSDCNVLLDPRQRAAFAVARWARIPFDWLAATAT